MPEPADATPLALNSLFFFICWPNINHSLTPRPSVWWRQQVELHITGYDKPKEVLKENHFYRLYCLARLKLCSWKYRLRLTAVVISSMSWGTGTLFNNEQLQCSSTSTKTKHYVRHDKLSINTQKCLSAWKYCHLQRLAASFSYLPTVLLFVLCYCQLHSFVQDFLASPWIFFLPGNTHFLFISGSLSSFIRYACP